jgi:hypothetical protein
MLVRDFNVIRRRPHIVDLLARKKVGVRGYRLEAATNFDAAFTPIITADISSGFLDPSIDSSVLHTVPNRDAIRIVFNPDSFSGVAGINDDHHFWLRFVPVDFAGVVGVAGNPALVITDYEHYGMTRVLIAGNAPDGNNVNQSQQLDLPFTTQDLYIKNEEPAGGADLYLAALPGGAEQQIAPQDVLSMFFGPLDFFIVRGAGKAVRFSASFTNYLPI